MNRRVKLLSMFIIFMIMITACGSNNNKEVINHNYKFTGENDRWSGEYVATSSESFDNSSGTLKYDIYSDVLCKVTYKGELSELSNVKQIEISYKTNSSSGKLVNNYSDNESITSKEFILESGESDVKLSKDEEIYIEINIDGVTESIVLK